MCDCCHHRDSRQTLSIVGENVNFKGPEEYVRRSGVNVVVVNDSESIRMMKKFIDENPDLWNEDIGELEIER